MITLTDAQKSRAYSATPRAVTLVRIETYSDWTAKTVANTLYFATVPLRYRWDGATVNTFRGLISRVDPLVRGMRHIPSRADLDTRDGISIEFESGSWGPTNIWDLLTSEKLIGAKIEVATLLLDWIDETEGGWIDQSTATADHLVRFRGEITQVPDYGEDSTTFTLVADSLEPILPWPSALNETEVSQKDLGKRYPMPVGRPKRLPLIQRQVGWFTTISADLTETTTGTIQVTDTAGLPAAGTFGIWIGTERLTVSVVDDTSISIVARGTTTGIGGVATTARIHNAGSVLIEEIAVARFVFSGVPILGMTSLYARSPHTGELVLIPKGLYGFATQDEALDTGEKLGVVSFTPKLWGQLIQLLNNEAKVTVQPAQSGVETVFIKFGSMGITTTRSGSVNCEVFGPFQSGFSANETTTGSPQNAGRFTMDSATVPSQSRVVSRYRAVFDYRIETDSVNVTTFYYDWVNILGSTKAKTLLDSNPAGTATEFNTKASPWTTPAGGTTLASMVNGLVHIFMDNTAGGSSGTEISVYATSRWEVELESLAIDTATETSGAQEIGFNLDLFADVLGAVNLGTETALTNFDEIAQVDNDWVGVDCLLLDIPGPDFGIQSYLAGAGTDITRTMALLGMNPAIDLSGARMVFEYKLNSGTWDGMDDGWTAFQIQLLSSAGNYVRWTWPKSVLHGDDSWHKFTLEIYGSGPEGLDGAGTLDSSNVIQINIDWTMQVASYGGAFSIRNLRSEARSFPEHPVDVAEWLIEDVAGVTADTTTFATARTNLPSVTVSGDLRSAGAALSELLAVLGYESRTNFVPYEGASATSYKAHNALATYAFGASVRTVDEYRALFTSTRQLDERPTEFIAAYNYREDLPAGALSGYQSLLQANATTNDISADVPTATITTEQALVGVRSSDPRPFTLLNDSVSAIEVFAYYVKEALRGTALRFSMRVPYRYGYDLEAGDIVEFVPPWQAGVIKCRVLEIDFPFDDPAIGLVLEEVT